MSEWTDVCAVEELAPDEHHIVDLDGVEVAVFNIDGDYRAIEDVCTHDGGELAHGPVEGCEVICPRHGARFCLKTGEALTPPAYEPVETFPVRVDNGMIQTRDPRFD